MSGDETDDLLIDALLDQPDRDERERLLAELAPRLVGDEALARRYLARRELDAELRRLLVPAADAAFINRVATATGRVPARRRRPTRLWVVALITAAAAAALAVAILHHRTAASAAVPRGTVVETCSPGATVAIADGDPRPLRPGPLGAAPWSLASGDGAIALVLADGHRLRLTGGRLAAPSAGPLQLPDGTLAVDSVGDAASLAIRTGDALLEVLGTRFTVDAAPGRTRLRVDEGRVRLTRADDGRALEIAAGGAADTALPGLDAASPPMAFPSHGLRLRFAADRGVTGAADGAVAMWRDLVDGRVARPRGPPPRLVPDGFRGRPALAFHDDDCCLQLDDSPPLAGVVQGTIAAWVRVDAVRPGDFHGIVAVDTPRGTAPCEFGLRDGGPELWRGPGPAAMATAYRGPAAPAGVWRHLAYVAAESGARLLVDGRRVPVQVVGRALPAAPFLDPAGTAGLHCRIGATGERNERPAYRNGEVLGGMLAELAVWDRALDDDEIRAAADGR